MSREFSLALAEEQIRVLRKSIAQLKEELAKYKGEWEREEYRCPQCGTGNPKVAQLKAENEALKRENEKYRLLIIDCPECYRTLKSLYATFTKKDTLLKESE